MKSITLIFIVLFVCLLSSVLAAESAPNITGLYFHHHVIVKGEYRAEDHEGHTKRAAVQPLTHQQLVNIYAIPWSTSAGSGQTVAIVIAYGSSRAEFDLSEFIARRAPYLPQCTTANGCFTRVNQNGNAAGPFPADDAGWGLEANLDLQTVHAIAPGARKILICANSNAYSDIFVAIQTGTRLAQTVTMSLGGSEFSGQSYYDSNYFAPSYLTTFIASSGDSATVQYPSSSPYVVSVGGTSILTNPDFSFYGENGWSGSGGGCSAYAGATAQQASNPGYPALGCAGKRATPDVSYDADPNSGVVIFSSYSCTYPNCLYIVGGTSLAAPIFAGRTAIRRWQITPDVIYGGYIAFRDVTTGGTAYNPCTPGLDKVTGLGDWIYDVCPASKSVLGSTQGIYSNQPNAFLSSTDCRFRASVQGDGNFVIYKKTTTSEVPIWYTGTHLSNPGPFVLIMQGDGNLVMYDRNSYPVWYSSTAGVGRAPHNLIMQSDGNLVVYDANGTPTWWSGTSGN